MQEVTTYGRGFLSYIVFLESLIQLACNASKQLVVKLPMAMAEASKKLDYFSKAQITSAYSYWSGCDGLYSKPDKQCHTEIYGLCIEK